MSNHYKPPQWIIDDIRSLRQNKNRDSDEEKYLQLLLGFMAMLQGKKK